MILIERENTLNRLQKKKRGGIFYNLNALQIFFSDIYFIYTVFRNCMFKYLGYSRNRLLKGNYMHRLIFGHTVLITHTYILTLWKIYVCDTYIVYKKK